MKFGYFTLSDNAYPNNARSPERFITEIREQAIYADQLGMNSAWIGEHHFDSLGVNSRPGTLLASIVPITKSIRLAPAVAVLPLHHPLDIAEEWATIDLISGGRVDFAAGRGYDTREYDPFGAPFMDSKAIFAEGIDVIQKAWNSPGPWSHDGKYFHIPEMEITPKPVQKPIPFYLGSFSETSVDMAAERGLNIIYAPFAAAMVFGGLDRAVEMYREKCERHGHTPGRTICSYFVHFADTPEEDERGREFQISYFKNCALPAFPKNPTKMPPTMQYFIKMCDILENIKKEDLTDKSILIGPSSKVIETLKRVEAAGISEVILYFNVGNKPHQLVKDQMAKFMEEVAPAFSEVTETAAG